jgi:hypothetical protein
MILLANISEVFIFVLPELQQIGNVVNMIGNLQFCFNSTYK